MGHLMGQLYKLPKTYFMTCCFPRFQLYKLPKTYFVTRCFHFSQEKMGHSLKKGAKMGQYGADAPYMGRPIKKGALWEP